MKTIILKDIYELWKWLYVESDKFSIEEIDDIDYREIIDNDFDVVFKEIELKGFAIKNNVKIKVLDLSI